MSFRGGVLDELSAHLDVLEKRSDLAGLVIRSGKPGSFIAGADLFEFAASFDMPKSEVAAMCNHGRKLFQRLSNCPFVTVAAIDGICVGGGAELAVWCDRRVMADDPKTVYGFPEVKIGLFPGWGGTARTSRIIGLANAVELVTSSENIDARTAYKMGLAGDIVPPTRIQDAAVRLIRAEQKSKLISKIANGGASRSTSMKPNSVFSAQRLTATSSSKPKDSTLPRWRRWK